MQIHTSTQQLRILGCIAAAFLLTACGSDLASAPASPELFSSSTFPLSATPAFGQAPLKVNFRSSARSDDKRWKLKNGSNKAWGKHVKYVYTQPGTYSVTLDTSSPGLQTPDAAMSVTVLPSSTKPNTNKPPIAFFTVKDITDDKCPEGPSNLIPPDVVSFSFDASASSDLDGRIVSYTWEFDDVTTTGRSVIRRYSTSSLSAPIHKVKLTVRDNRGKSSTVEMSRTFEASVCANPSDPGNP